MILLLLQSDLEQRPLQWKLQTTSNDFLNAKQKLLEFRKQ